MRGGREWFQLDVGNLLDSVPSGLSVDGAGIPGIWIWEGGLWKREIHRFIDAYMYICIYIYIYINIYIYMVIYI